MRDIGEKERGSDEGKIERERKKARIQTKRKEDAAGRARSIDEKSPTTGLSRPLPIILVPKPVSSTPDAVPP